MFVALPLSPWLTHINFGVQAALLSLAALLSVLAMLKKSVSGERAVGC
jgi:hypothetical protein